MNKVETCLERIYDEIWDRGLPEHRVSILVSISVYLGPLDFALDSCKVHVIVMPRLGRLKIESLASYISAFMRLLQPRVDLQSL